MTALEGNGKTVEFDGEGYLVHFDDWGKEVGLTLAKSENLEMTDDHWVVLQLMRDYYRKHELIPTARDFTDLMGRSLGSDKGNKKYLDQLFPNEQLKQCAKIAGLPRLAGCT